MKKMLIYGAGNRGKEAFEQLKNEKVVIAFTDSNTSLYGKKIDGIEIVSMEWTLELIRESKVEEIFFAVPNAEIEKVTPLYRKEENVRGYILPDLYYENGRSFMENIVEIDLSKPRLHHIEISLAYHCNMKCKGCVHFSNLIESASFPNKMDVIRDLERLKQLFMGIYRLKLMGGEPLLNKDLLFYSEKARELFPDADIMITTNGLLISDTPWFQRLCRVMKKIIYISIYLYMTLYVGTLGR